VRLIPVGERAPACRTAPQRRLRGRLH
jgi:hypothetical protein